VTLKVGDDPTAGAEPSMLIVLSGAVKVDREGAASESAEAGDAIGIYETLGGMRFPVKVEVATTGQALRFTRSEVFDLLADDTDLLQGIFSGLLRAPKAEMAAM